jgi:ADP-ribose pyrophosphatase YjhB (NUDIX family)/chloramphenicol 3-O-phosphotransferase
MPTITVSAILLEHERVLLVRPAGRQTWTLPGGLLTDADDTVEDAIGRVLAKSIRLDVTEVDFLDTLYERLPGEVVVRNVFLVTRVSGTLPGTGIRGDLELRWVSLAEMPALPVEMWLAGSLESLLAGEQRQEDEPFDLGEIATALGRRIDDASWGSPEAATVFIISGPAGAGKSTVARALCERLPRSAHVDADLLRDMVIGGYASPVPGVHDRAARDEQIALAHRNACALARNFALTGLTAVIDDIVEERADLDRCLEELAGFDVAFVTLLPDADALRTRDQGRESEKRVGRRSSDLQRIIADNGETRGLRLDTSGLTVEETVTAILERIDEARVAPVRGASR